jgi:hypothetical protein
MRYDRARKDLDRHPNQILAAYMASWFLTHPCVPISVLKGYERRHTEGSSHAGSYGPGKP